MGLNFQKLGDGHYLSPGYKDISAFSVTASAFTFFTGFPVKRKVKTLFSYHEMNIVIHIHKILPEGLKQSSRIKIDSFQILRV